MLTIAAVAALSLTSCLNGTDYKAKGQELARQLDEFCQKQDADSVLVLDKLITDEMDAIIQSGDSAAIADFREAIKDSRNRNAPYITSLKLKLGVDKNTVIKDLEREALNEEIGMDAVASAIKELSDSESKEKQEKKTE